MNISFGRLESWRGLVALVLALSVFAVACGGSEDAGSDLAAAGDAAETATAAPVATAEPEQATAATAEPEQATAATAEPEQATEEAETETGTEDFEIETSTDDAMAEASNAALLQMANFFGMDNPEEAAACMTEKIESGGLTVEQAMTSGATLNAGLNCGADPVAIFGEIDEVDTIGTELDTPDVECAFEAMITLLRDAPIAESGELFTSTGPPQVIIDRIVSDCDVSPEDALFLLS